MRNELYDSGSRDQFPVDDDQDGRFNNPGGDDGQIPAMQDPNARVTSVGENGLDPLHGTPLADDLARDDDALARSLNGREDLITGEGSGEGDFAGGNSFANDPREPGTQLRDAHTQAGPEAMRAIATEEFERISEEQFQASVDQGMQSLALHQVAPCADTVIEALLSAGEDPRQIARDAGIASIDPHAFSKADLNKLLTYVKPRNPGVLGNAIATYPEMGEALGAPVVRGLIGKLTGR